MFWAPSSTDYYAAILFNAAPSWESPASAPRSCSATPTGLSSRETRVIASLLRAWIAIYAFVGIQLGWTLRPFIRGADQPVTFFRGGEWENHFFA